jgi:hypothetical protein
MVVFRNSRGVAKHLDEKTGKIWPVEYGLHEGASDLIGCFRGRFVALEVKRPGEYPTHEQRLFLALIDRLGGVAAVVRSVADALEALGLTEADLV